jgi:hypothetical protein
LVSLYEQIQHQGQVEGVAVICSERIADRIEAINEIAVTFVIYAGFFRGPVPMYASACRTKLQRSKLTNRTAYQGRSSIDISPLLLTMRSRPYSSTKKCKKCSGPICRLSRKYSPSCGGSYAASHCGYGVDARLRWEGSRTLAERLRR